MTEPTNHPPHPEPEKSNPLKRLVNKLKSSPKKLTGGVVAIAALGSLGYWGTGILVKKKLPPFLSSQIGKIIERPIDLGEVKGFSLNSIEFGKTIIPATTTDTDKVTVDGVKVGFNIFPVLFRQTLPLDATLINPDIYLEQTQDGEWINLDFLANREKKDPLIYFDVDLDVEQAEITAVPYQQNPLQAQVDGMGRFNQKQGLLDYDLDTTIEQATATIKGGTNLETGSTDTKLLVKDLALSDAASLLPNSPVLLDSGSLNADLDINIPSFKEITAANIKGMVNLQNVTGEATELNAPVTAKSKLNFTGRNAEVKQTQATLGDLTAQVAGQVNLDTGYDLDVSILPFQLASLPPKLTKQLPVGVAGEIEAQVKLRGEIKEPQLTGNVNNIQTVIVEQTPFKRITADFRANLARVVLENIQLIPLAGGNVQAEGTVETNLGQVLREKQQLDFSKMPVAFSFQANLPTRELVSPYYQLPQQVAIGDLQAQGQIDGTIKQPKGLVKWNIADSSASNLEDIAGSGELVIANQNLFLRDTQVTYGDGTAEILGKANLENKKWQAQVDANSLNLTPFAANFSNANLNLNHPLAINTATANFNGRLDRLDPEQIEGTAVANLNVNGGNTVVDSQIKSGNLQAKVITSNIKLDPYVTSLPVAASLQNGIINASGKVKQLLTFQKNPSLNSFLADANLDLLVDGEAVAVDSQIDSGKITAQANTSQIDLNRLVPKLPVPANIQSSQVLASGEVRQLLTYDSNPNLSSFDVVVDADLGVANGTTKAIANLNNNQWQANLNANNVSSSLLLDTFAPRNYASVELDNINAQANLSGDILPILNNEANVPVNVNRVTANSGVQNLNAQGNLILSNITSNLDAASNLDVTANLDFDRLPISQVVASASQNNQLVAESVNVQGKAAFNGKFIGQQLLSAPAENLNLTGDLRLLDFAFNDIDFDPVMAGTLDVQPQQQIALNLQGEQDVITASAVPCKASNCKLPYLPTNVELRQGEDTNQPVIVTGDRTGDIFALDIQNFPLALLNLAPGTAAGIDGALAGKTTGEIDLNLNTLATEGNIAIANPAIGYIQAKQLEAEFAYDPVNNIAQVTSSSLNLGESRYNLNAALNLESGEIDGKLSIPQAYIQDALTTLRWFTIEDAISLFRIPDYAEVNAVKPAPEKETVDQSVARKLNQLRLINKQIQANAAAREAGNVPTELDIRGKYQGEVILGGTIQTPQADFKVEGGDWQWQPTLGYPAIVNPLGLVIEESQYIAFPKVLIAGELLGTTVDLEEAMVQVQEAVLSLKGKLSPEQLDAKFNVNNLTVDNITNFVTIPVDVAGEINSVGTIKGTVEQPQLEGKVAFANGAFNGNVLPAQLAGDFNYDGSKLAFNTTAPEAIKVEAEVPYPIIPVTSDRITAKANIDQEAFVFLSALSQNYLNWLGGKGDAQLEATARLDLNRKGILYDLSAQGVVNLQDANVAVETPFFTEQFVGTGKITLNNQIVNVENLDATFADKDLSVKGKLPILTAVANLDNPLTIDLPPGEIQIDKLYEGGVAGEVMVTGASLAPVIGGEVTLEDGQVFIPKVEKPTQADVVQLAGTQVNNLTSNQPGQKTKAQAKSAKSAQPNKSAIITALNNLKVKLKDFKLEQAPIYNFQLEGDLTLNGTVDKPSNIIPKGTLLLTKADVDVFSSSFNLARNRENTIIFTPNAGVFNPQLDVILKTQVEDIDQQDADQLRLAESNSNEIDDPLSEINDSQTVRISLVVNGETTDILPNLAQTVSLNCNVRPPNQSLKENDKYYTASELNQYTQCFRDSSSSSVDNRSLVNSPAVELTSIPSLNRGEIINLLSGQFLAFAGKLSNSSQSQLFDLGVNKFILSPLQNSLLYKVEDTTVGFGRKLGLDYLTVFPNLEGVYEINQNSSINSTYNYVLNEARVEYQRNF